MSPILNDAATALGWVVIAGVVLLGIAFMAVGFVVVVFRMFRGTSTPGLRVVSGGERSRTGSEPAPPQSSPTGPSPEATPIRARW